MERGSWQYCELLALRKVTRIHRESFTDVPANHQFPSLRRQKKICNCHLRLSTRNTSEQANHLNSRNTMEARFL
jgi:hypothetical protein